MTRATVWRQVLAWGIGLAVGAAAVWLLLRVRAILTPFFFALVIAYISHPVVVALERRDVPRSYAIVSVYLMVAVGATLAFFLFLPGLSRELDDAMRMLPDQTRWLEGITRGALRPIENISFTGIDQAVNDTVRRAEAFVSGFAARVASFLPLALSSFLSLLIAPILAYYMLRDYDRLKRSTLAWIPKENRRVWLSLMTDLSAVLSGFVRGQLIVSLVVAALTAGAYALLGVPYAILLALLAGLFNVVPYFGPVIAGLPAVALALTQSPATAVWVVVAIMGINQVESIIISPRVMGSRVGLHPLAVVFTVLAGSQLLGIFGMLIAVPAAAVIRVLMVHVAAHLFGVARKVRLR